MKFFSKMFAVAFALMASVASADFSTNTAQLPASATITAAKDGNGNVIVTWAGFSVKGAEVYVGHGTRAGVIQKVDLSKADKLVLKDGGRFNLVVADGRFVHLECGGNDRTSMPGFKGLAIDCSFVDPASGQKVGAMVVASN